MMGMASQLGRFSAVMVLGIAAAEVLIMISPFAGLFFTSLRYEPLLGILSQSRLTFWLDGFFLNHAMEVAPSFAAMTKAHTEALLVIDSAVMAPFGRLIVSWALDRHLPMISTSHSLTKKGGLMSYRWSHHAMLDRGAALVDKLLKGAKPGELPIERPQKFDLVINLKTAKALGITIPPEVLFQATEVIR